MFVLDLHSSDGFRKGMKVEGAFRNLNEISQFELNFPLRPLFFPECDKMTEQWLNIWMSGEVEESCKEVVGCGFTPSIVQIQEIHYNLHLSKKGAVTDEQVWRGGTSQSPDLKLIEHF